MRVAVIRPGEGPVVEDRPVGLEDLQGLVGGYIEAIHCPDQVDPDAPGVTMFVAEEGLRLGYEPNWCASAIAGRPIVGTAVLTGVPVGGEVTPLPPMGD